MCTIRGHYKIKTISWLLGTAKRVHDWLNLGMVNASSQEKNKHIVWYHVNRINLNIKKKNIQLTRTLLSSYCKLNRPENRSGNYYRLEQMTTCFSDCRDEDATASKKMTQNQLSLPIVLLVGNAIKYHDHTEAFFFNFIFIVTCKSSSMNSKNMVLWDIIVDTFRRRV